MAKIILERIPGLRILLCNNFVRDGSGTDAVVRMEERCLTSAGHEVVLYGRSNTDFDKAGIWERVTMLMSILYSFPVRRETNQILSENHFDFVHIHNTVPFLTGALYDACRKHPETTVVQSLHNYRPFCLSSYSFRKDAPCTKCIDDSLIWCAVYGCYRNSRIQSLCALIARWLDRSLGRKFGIDADAYVAVSHFMKSRCAKNGIPSNRIHILRNASQDLRSQFAGPGRTTGKPRKKLVYTGSIAAAKGVMLLPLAASCLDDFEFHIIGDGSDTDRLKREIERRKLANVMIHGYKEGKEKFAIWSDAFLSLVPSLWDEPFGLVVPESFSLGIPVIASGAGALSEIVTDKENGIIANFKNPADVASIVRNLWENRTDYDRLRDNSRITYETRYSERAYSERLCELLENLGNKRQEQAEERSQGRAGNVTA